MWKVGGAKAALGGSLDEVIAAAQKSKTIVDALAPAQKGYQDAVGAGSSFCEALHQMAQAAERGKESTRDLVAKIGLQADLENAPKATWALARLPAR